MKFSFTGIVVRRRGGGAGLAGFGLAAMLPLVALAEISNDGLIGPGLRSRPAYDGSSAQRTELVPVIRYFGQPFFARSTQGVLEAGVRTELAPGLHAGAQLAYEAGRQTADSEFLRSHHLAGIQRGVSVGLHLEWDQMVGPMLRISAIVDACFSVIVDGVSAPSWTRGGCAQARGLMYLNRPRSF